MRTEAQQIAELVAALQSVPSWTHYQTKAAFEDAWLEWVGVRAVALVHAGASYDFQCSPPIPAGPEHLVENSSVYIGSISRRDRQAGAPPSAMLAARWRREGE